MLIKAPKEKLLSVLNVIQNAVSTKTTMAILNNFYIGIKGQTVHLAATDLEIFVEATFKADALKTDKEKPELSDGECAIPAKRFIEMVREQDAGRLIEVKTDDGSRLNVKCGRSRFNLPCFSPKDYPEQLEFPKQKIISVQSVLLRDMIEKTIFSVSVEDVRYALNGVYFVVEKNTLKLVATDSRRLAFVSGEIEGAKFSHTAIVPHKALVELLRLMDLMEATEIKIGFSDNQVSFAVNEAILSSRLIDSEFPNYERVIPKESQITSKIKARELLGGLKQLQFLAQDKSSAVKFSFQKGGINLMASVAGVGQGEVELDADYTDKPIDIVFNLNYVMDFLKVAKDSEIRIELVSGVSPVVFSPSDAPSVPNLKKYLYIVMPIRTE
ncbi:MAG: DNA polymerase III subunit beta [Elusimicrobia bacterium HGW-Elusimicrobia-1]|jgi:DNA polymerase-3 subunit beta|nr:MAG: DNA polymerase III subunit beta [Elusimicrobia bacterium HGW-Elusimicrobia-1]